MGLIKEPAGVDFVIQSEPYTDIDRKEISDYITASKFKNKKARKKVTAKKTSNVSQLH